MMISPEGYVDNFKDSSYEELIAERDRLIKSIKEYEEKEGERSGSEWDIKPSPDVIYQWDLECLADLCLLICEKYRTEYVWGDENLDEEEERT